MWGGECLEFPNPTEPPQSQIHSFLNIPFGTCLSSPCIMRCIRLYKDSPHRRGARYRHCLPLQNRMSSNTVIELKILTRCQDVPTPGTDPNEPALSVSSNLSSILNAPRSLEWWYTVVWLHKWCHTFQPYNSQSNTYSYSDTTPYGPSTVWRNIVSCRRQVVDWRHYNISWHCTVFQVWSFSSWRENIFRWRQ